MEKKIKMGIVGAGTWGRTHAYIYREHSNAEPVAICDMNRERAQAIADEFGIKEVYTDYHEMAEKADIDAVAIVTPDFAHADIACCFADHKRHLLIEKPLATTREDAERIVEAVKRNGVRCMVDLHNRWNAPFNTCKQLIEAGKLGDPYTAYIRHRHQVVRHGPASLGGQVLHPLVPGQPFPGHPALALQRRSQAGLRGKTRGHPEGGGHRYPRHLSVHYRI